MKNKSVLFFISLAFFTPFAHAATCNVGENDLKGVWLATNSYAAFEQMEFGIEDGKKVFNSWLHERPEIMDGNWSLKNCNLHVAHTTNPDMTYNFVARLNHGKLELKEKGEPPGKFRQMKE